MTYEFGDVVLVPFPFTDQTIKGLGDKVGFHHD